MKRKLFTHLTLVMSLASFLFSFNCFAEPIPKISPDEFVAEDSKVKLEISVIPGNSNCVESGGKIAFTSSQRKKGDGIWEKFVKVSFIYTTAPLCKVLMAIPGITFKAVAQNDGTNLILLSLEELPKIIDSELATFSGQTKTIDDEIEKAGTTKHEADLKLEEEKKKLEAKIKLLEDEKKKLEEENKKLAAEKQKTPETEKVVPPGTSVPPTSKLGDGVYINNNGDTISCKISWIFRNKLRCFFLELAKKTVSASQTK
ncbi:MAG: hypothetical protein QE271_06805 [Bacteriovoracaceae bacterium]|nr:hypothetical protein [Bacteriovoracaceae bacterium]